MKKRLNWILPGLSLWFALNYATPVFSENYIVRRGDSLSKIAQRYGCNFMDIAKANNISNPNRIRVGQKLKIPSEEKMSYNPNEQSIDSRINELVKNKQIQKWQVKIAKGMLHTKEANLDKILDHYEIDKKVFYDIMAQESGYDIKVTGPCKERGTSQFIKSTADSVARQVADPNSDLYYPGFDIKKYSFERLGKSYELNNILKAALLKKINNITEKKHVNRNRLYKRLKEKGMDPKNHGFFGKTSVRLKPKLIKLWKTKSGGYKDTLITYLYYNGGGKMSREVVYHMGLLIKNAEYYRKIGKRVL